MHFQSQHGQTKVVFDSQGKNALQYVAFSIEIFIFKIEIGYNKKLKRQRLQLCLFTHQLLIDYIAFLRILFGWLMCTC
jgi:hypothetical protein